MRCGVLGDCKRFHPRVWGVVMGLTEVQHIFIERAQGYTQEATEAIRVFAEICEITPQGASAIMMANGALKALLIEARKEAGFDG